MLLALAYCDKDYLLAENLFRWMAELDGRQTSHSLFLLASGAISAERRAVVETAADSAFLFVRRVAAKTIDERGWPRSCNTMFLTAYHGIRKELGPQPFFWIEPDCTPIKSGWLDEFESEYKQTGKPFMGAVFDQPVKHLTGCAIYPADIGKYNAAILSPGNKPWDVVNPEATLRNAHHTQKFQHVWGDIARNIAPTFPDQESLRLVRPDALLFHRCKDFSLAERLREQRANPAPPSLLDRAVNAVSKIVRSVVPHPKIDLLYICVRSPSEPNVPRNFRESHERFVRTYKQFKPEIPHRLIIVCYNGERDAETDALFAGLNPTWAYYNGTGFDIGTYLTIGRTLDSDFLLCCGSNVHFHRKGWLERMVGAFQKHGPGGFASSASYENSPHLRTGCIGTTPKLLRQYPHTIATRLESYKFESGEWSFTGWLHSQNLPALMVTWDGELAQSDWRKPPNIFRRGDQSNMVVWDRHTKVYADANDADRKQFARMADGPVAPNIFIKRPRHKTITVVAPTSLNPVGHAKAIEWTASLIPHPCEKLLICSEPAPGFTGKQMPLPSPWAKNGKWEVADMADFLLTGLHDYIKTDVAIVVHDDGYALNRANWADEFLDFDFIGAPWPRHFSWVKPDRRVGNGGFSLRSSRWLKRASELYRLPRGESEDMYVSIKHLDHFIHADCRIAPVDVALRWSFEHTIEEFPNWKMLDSFGWHGRTKELPERKHLKLK